MKVIEITMSHIDQGKGRHETDPYHAMLTALRDSTGKEVKLDITSNNVHIGNKFYGITSTLLAWLHACKEKDGDVMPIKLLLTDGEYPIIALCLYNPDEDTIVEWYNKRNADKEDSDVCRDNL